MSLNYKPTIKRLLRPFNLVVPATPYGHLVQIPIMRGVGGSNRTGSEPWMVDALKSLFSLSGRTGLIDVGVNIGQTLLKFKRIDQTGRYIGFEPNPFCVVFANELIELNRWRNCVILPVALSTRAGLVEFVADKEADSAASIVRELRPDTSSVRHQYIAMLRFDDIADDLALEDMPVVKIDVEGAELDVLSGMQDWLRRCRPMVICEVLRAHSPMQIKFVGARNQALMKLLEGIGYTVLRIRKDAGQASVTALEPVPAFPEEVFSYTSFAVCDYLMAPVERLPEVIQAFGKASVGRG